MATNRQKVLALLKEYGASLVTDRDDEIEVEAPAGMVWRCDTSLHALVASRWDDECKDDLWADVLGRMKYGVTQCTEPDCEWCHPDPQEE
jgi:hypothetical protein